MSHFCELGLKTKVKTQLKLIVNDRKYVFIVNNYSQ